MELFEQPDLAHGIVDFKIYTAFVRKQKVYPEEHSIIYPTIGLAEESGEVSGKVKKWLRGDIKELDKLSLIRELGDCLWYITSLADDLGYTLDQVARINIDKIQDREKRGVKKGLGDYR